MKRMTETEKWDDPWFRALKPELKTFWEFIRDRCDSAGVWKVDFAAAEFFIGVKFSPDEVLAAFDGRIKDVGRGKWWIVKFVSFQCCGPLSEKSIPHQKIAAKLKEHGLWDAFNAGPCEANQTHETPPQRRVVATLQEEEKKKSRIEVRGSGGNPEQPPPVEYPKGFPPDERIAVDWARAGGCRATDEQIRLYWNEAASRNGHDVTGQPVTRWLQHCNGRAIRNEGKVAESQSRASATSKLWALKTQLESVQAEIKRLEGKQLRDEDGKPVIKPEDREKYRDLKKKFHEINEQIATGGK